jgi:hypothetical protein
MTPQDLDAFDQQARAQGYTELLDRDWAPDTAVPTHSHPFDASAVLTRGEMWLSCGDETRHLLPGDTFALARDQPHTERYGPAGASYRVARRGGV